MYVRNAAASPDIDRIFVRHCGKYFAQYREGNHKRAAVPHRGDGKRFPRGNYLQPAARPTAAGE